MLRALKKTDYTALAKDTVREALEDDASAHLVDRDGKVWRDDIQLELGTYGYEPPELLAFDRVSRDATNMSTCYPKDLYVDTDVGVHDKPFFDSHACDSFSLGTMLMSIISKYDEYIPFPGDDDNTFMFFILANRARSIIRDRGETLMPWQYRLDTNAEERLKATSKSPNGPSTSIYSPKNEYKMRPDIDSGVAFLPTQESYDAHCAQVSDDQVLLMHKLNVINMLCPDPEYRAQNGSATKTLAAIGEFLKTYSIPVDIETRGMPTFTIILESKDAVREIAEYPNVLAHQFFMGPTRYIASDDFTYSHANDPMFAYLAEKAKDVQQCIDTAELDDRQRLPSKRPPSHAKSPLDRKRERMFSPIPPEFAQGHLRLVREERPVMYL